ncbi:hypothetical protein SLEP1_g58428 [Rubroshorea leprosula]|uniref:Uncharacterized protein n=1 Tax=Rubroshorea leprosula TaxID=152421 RepID=A0AAV5MS26_9ROSI|nr:hypothetical protein SLEP1_g58428 [Rubroshorea leprosula]
MNALASGRFVQRTILTRFCSFVRNEVITKFDEKDQKADAEMKKVITLVTEKEWVFIQVKYGCLFGKTAPPLREHDLEKVVEDIGSTVRVIDKDCDKLFVQRTILTRFCSSVHNEVIIKLDEKDQKADVEMKKVITPILEEAWVFVQVDCPIELVEALVSKLKDHKVIIEMKKVVIPIQGCVQLECHTIEMEVFPKPLAIGSKPMDLC